MRPCRLPLAALLCSLLLAAHGAARADTALISPDEYARELQLRAALPDTEPGTTPLRAKAFDGSGAPRIEVRLPQALQDVKAPFPIQLVFRTAEGADIDTGSFKVFYGFLKLDITERLLQKAQLTREGLSLADAAIPAGTHKLLIRVRDSRQREGELQVALKVL